MFASVLGYDALSKTTIGKDTQGRYVGYRPKGTHRYFYLSQKHWLKLKSKGSTVLSKAYNRSVLAESNAENEFEVGSDLYTGTHFYIKTRKFGVKGTQGVKWCWTWTLKIFRKLFSFSRY